jgi:hypothetical protein
LLAQNILGPFVENIMFFRGSTAAPKDVNCCAPLIKVKINCKVVGGKYFRSFCRKYNVFPPLGRRPQGCKLLRAAYKSQDKL